MYDDYVHVDELNMPSINWRRCDFAYVRAGADTYYEHGDFDEFASRLINLLATGVEIDENFSHSVILQDLYWLPSLYESDLKLFDSKLLEYFVRLMRATDAEVYQDDIKLFEALLEGRPIANFC